MPPKSNTLFHFTKNIDILKSILKNGFYPRYCLEDISLFRRSSDTNVAFPMVCFCDIPLARITDHVKFYGQYGIGVSRDWALNNGLNPVAYLSNNSQFKTSFHNNLITVFKTYKKTNDNIYIENARYTIAYTKPLTGTMFINGKYVTKDFYQESEWRYVAKDGVLSSYLSEKQMSDAAIVKKYNDEAALKANIKVKPNEVKYLFVKSETDIPDLVNYINQDLDSFTSKDLKILTTRIITLDIIDKDI